MDLLYHIDEWDAILCRRKNNQHLVILQTGYYYQVKTVHAPVGKSSHALAEAREIIENLPQLLLD